ASYEYNSDNTTILTVEEIKEKLLTLKYVRTELSKYHKRQERLH
ncbi:UDP-glucose 4-epimerase, partial [Staphylococcus arlettae]